MEKLFREPIRMEPTYFFEVKLKNINTFNTTKSGSNQKAWVLADNARDIELEILGWDRTGKTYPGVVAELYVDGVLRNVTKLRTGRGLKPNQFGDLAVDRRIILTEAREPVIKKFRFIDLDLDDCKY
jgi:hypothetical protein